MRNECLESFGVSGALIDRREDVAIGVIVECLSNSEERERRDSA
jgi:hypothetical protein